MTWNSAITSGAQAATLAPQIAGLEATSKAMGLAKDAGQMQVDAIVQAGKTAMFNTQIATENKVRAYTSEADAAKFNATVDRQLADTAVAESQASARDYRVKGSYVEASQKASGAASGLSFEGSRLLVNETTGAAVDFGSSRIGREGDVKAVRLRNEALLYDKRSNDAAVSAAFAKYAGEESLKNISEATQIQAKAAAINSLGAQTKLQGEYLKQVAGITNTSSTMFDKAMSGIKDNPLNQPIFGKKSSTSVADSGGSTWGNSWPTDSSEGSYW